MEIEKLQVAVGKVIRRRRLALGYSQESFADDVGLHRTYMGSVERGERNISLQNIARIAVALKVSLSVLFADIEAEIAAMETIV